MESTHKTDTFRGKTAALEPSGATQLPMSTNCLACSKDGRYLSLGHSRGLSVWCASSLTSAAEWQQAGMEITSIQMTRTAEEAYLLGTVDDMGVARVFAYHCEAIHPLCVINIMENINKRSICLTFELSEGGNYGAASMSCNGAVWLEIYQFPSEAWLKETEKPLSQQQRQHWMVHLRCSRGQISLPTVWLWKERTAAVINGRGRNMEDHDVAPSTSSCLVVSSLVTVKPCCCQDYLLLSVCGGVAAIIFFSIHCRTHQRTKQEWYVEPTPDVLWPNAKEIQCSAVSGCSRHIALGLDGALVCVWDRQSGSPLSIVVVSATDSSFFRMQFVDNWPQPADVCQTFAAKVCLLLLCKSGEMYTVTAGGGTQSCTEQLSERQKDSADLPTVTASVPFLQSLSLVVQRNGKMFLQDVINRTNVCSLVLPTTHPIATSCSPVYALNRQQQTLFIKGDQESCCSAPSEVESRSQLFIFRLGEQEIIKRYIVSHPDSPQQLDTLSCVTLEETCDLYLQQRAWSVEERNKDLGQTWKHLQETAARVQRRNSNAAAS